MAGSSLIVTLGTLSLYRAVALIYTGGSPVFGILPSCALFNTSPLGIPNPVLIVAVLALLVRARQRRRRILPRRPAAMRRRPASPACRSPPPASRATPSQGVLAAMAGLILVGRLGAADPTLGNLWELDVIAAAAICGLAHGRQGLDRRHAPGCHHPRAACATASPC
ncbi:MAG: hypothetical protein U1E17_16490 [Geminicoccaceae bacterium]